MQQEGPAVWVPEAALYISYRTCQLLVHTVALLCWLGYTR